MTCELDTRGKMVQRETFAETQQLYQIYIEINSIISTSTGSVEGYLYQMYF